MQQNTVLLRVQVIDMEPKKLDLRLPLFLRASDVSQRIAREAGLQTFWPDNTRKLYALRARGRLLHPDETLGNLQIMDNELLYILPQIRPNTPLQEQYPEYPVETNYAAGALSILCIQISVIMFFSVNWGLSIAESGHWATLLFPSMGIGVMCTAFARHAWGGKAMRIKIIGSALVLYLMAIVPCFVVSYIIPIDEGFGQRLLLGFGTGFVGLLISWIAWWGAVEPLVHKKVVQKQVQAKKTQHQCGLCGGGISSEVLEFSACCNRWFHTGCYAASHAAYRGPKGFCPICKKRQR